MNFWQAFEALKAGSKVKRKHWAGYWVKENGTIMMYLKDGTKMDIRETEDVFFTIQNLTVDDWEVVDSDEKFDIQTFTFGEALRKLKQGYKVARKGWNGKGMFIYLVKGTIVEAMDLRNEAGIHIGDNTPPFERVRINSHIDMKAADGSIVVGWTPSQTDMLAEDWVIVI